MNKKRKTAIVALLSVFAATTAFAACEAAKNITEVPTDKEYGYKNPDRVYAQPDEGFKIDGKADEAAYQNSTWVTLNNKNGTNTVDLSMTSHFGEKGMYFVYDVTENTPIYVNHDRASYINSGIEMYFAPNGVASMKNDHVYEIDIEADGKVTFKKTAGYGGQWVNVGTTSDIMAYAASNPKGGEINSGECYGYTLEFFIPWDYIEWLGMTPETMKEESVSVNPVHITSYNYNGTQYEVDRYWYSFATQLGGDGWDNVGQYFKFNKNGVVGAVPVTYAEGEHCTLSGADAVIPGLPLTVTVTPEKGYAVSSLTCNGGECVKLLNYNKDGSATYTVTGADDGMAFSAAAEAVTEGNKNLTGKINLKKAGGDTLDGLSASYFDADGEHNLPLNEGAFALNNLPQGYYEITAQKDGYGKITRGIYLNRDIDTQIDLEFGTFDREEGSCWDISNANEGYLIKKSGRGAILSRHSYDTFYAEANFRYDAELATQSSADEYYQQRMGFRIKFSGGKYWHPDVMCEGGVYKVTYGKIKKDDSIFDWNTVHVMTAKQIAQYKSDEGIRLGVLRIGTKAYIYLDGDLVAQTDLGREGIKAEETAQIGFEGFVYNPENWRIDYTIQDEGADEVVLNATGTGATVLMDEYKVGDSVSLLLNKTGATEDVLLSLTVNGVEMSGSVKNVSGIDTLTLANNTSRTLNVEVVYGTPRAITANITVDSVWKANGIEFTFTNFDDPTNTKTATVVNNKMQIADMLQGRWNVSANVFGKDIAMGVYSVVSEDEKQIDLENVFIDGKLLDPSVIDLSKGSFVYHSSIDEDYSIRIDEKGDAYLAAKLKLGAEDKAKFLKGGEVSFGMYMTVEDDNGKEETHWVDFWIKNADGFNFFGLRTDFGWDEKICEPLTSQINSNQYAKALFGSGLTVVLRYNAETGAMETYLGANEYSVKYLRHWKDDANLFTTNGMVTKAGFRDNLTYGGTSVSLQAENFRYGKTLLSALGVENKNVVLEKDVTGGSVDINGTPKAGDDVTLTVTPDQGKILSSLVINGTEMAARLSENGGTLVFEDCTAATLNVKAVFIEPQNITATLNFAEGNNANGLQVRLMKNGSVAGTATVENNAAVFENLLQGTYQAQVNLYGYWADLGDAFYTLTDSQSFNVSNIFSDANHVDLDGNTAYTKGSGDAFYSIASSVTGDAWFAAKFKADKSTFEDGKAYRIGFRLFFGGATDWDHECDMTLVRWAEGHWGVQTCSKHWWSGPIPENCQNAIWNDGMYFVVHRSGSDGTIYCYFGTSLEDVALEAKNDHWVMNKEFQKQAITTFGVGYWGADSSYTASISEFRYGTTMLEAFGIEENDPITVTGAGAQEHGTVTVTENAVRGDDVTITLTSADVENYKIGSLKVNGRSIDVTTLTNGTYTLKNYLRKTLTVEATFVQVVRVNTTVTIDGKKLGFEGNAANGLAATLSDGTYTFEGRVTDGTITFNQVVTGKGYTLSIEGFLTATGIEVTESGIEGTVTIEYDTFYKDFAPWGDFDFSKQNDDEAQVSFTNDCCLILTKDTYDDVMFSIYLNKDLTGGDGCQGIAVRFIVGNTGYTAVVRMERNQKIHFMDGAVWENQKAEGSGWQNLIHFNHNGEGVADADSAALNKALNDGTCKLSVARRGATLYAFLNYDGKDRYIGSRTFTNENKDKLYDDVKVQIGLYTLNVPKGNKTMKVELTTDISAAINAVTDGNGMVTVPQTAVKAGDKATLTLTPNSGYVLKKLTVGGIDVTGSVSFDKETLVGTYEFVAAVSVPVAAEFEAIAYGAQNVGIAGGEYKATPVALADGTSVTLSNAMAEYTLTVTEGKLDLSAVMAGVYTLSADGYMPAKVTVASDMADIKLVTSVFKNPSGSADLTEVHLGKVTATGKDGISLTTVKEYADVSAEATFDLIGDYTVKQRRYSVGLVFGDGKVFRVDLDLHEGDRHIVQETQWDTMMGFGWGSPKEYTLDQVKAFENVKFKCVRKGDKVTIYVNDEEIKTYTLPEAYATQSAQVKFIFDSNGTDGTEGFTFDITVPEEVTE